MEKTVIAAAGKLAPTLSKLALLLEMAADAGILGTNPTRDFNSTSEFDAHQKSTTNSVNNDRRLLTMCGCSKAKQIEPEHSFGKLIDAVRSGYDSMIAAKRANGFDPQSPFQESGVARVHGLFDSLRKQYGLIDIGDDGGRLAAATVTLLQLKEVLGGLETVANWTAEDERAVADSIGGDVALEVALLSAG